MTEAEKTKISKKLKKAAYKIGLFWVIIFFTISFFSRDYSFIPSLIGSILGGFLGSYLYFLMSKKFTFGMLEEIERGFKATIIPGSRFESHVEIGENFRKKPGKIFITEDSMIFKPNRFNNSTNQPFDTIHLSEITSISVEEPLFFGNEKIKMSTNKKQFIITPLEDCSEVIKFLKPGY